MISLSVNFSIPLIKELNQTIAKSYGLSFGEFSFIPLQEKICDRMKILNMDSPEEYLSLIKQSKKEITNLVNILAINTTSFFRVYKHFKLLKNKLLPKIKEQNSAYRKIKILSAGCSNGPEPYSIAMELLDFFGAEAPLWDIEIIASDLNLECLLYAKQGIYKSSMLKHIPDLYQEHFCIKHKDYFEITPKIKKMVTWDYHNILYDHGYQDFDIIFCRNLLYYFEQPSQKKALEHFYHQLKPNGNLILGSSEYLTAKFTNLFEQKKDDDVYYYKKIENNIE